MTRREMVFQGLLAIGVVVGIVVGNFVLHRWVLGNAASREADAGTTPNSVAEVPSIELLSQDELDDPEFAPRKRVVSPEDAARVAAVRRQRLMTLIAEKLPNASPEHRNAWLDRLQDVELDVAADILELRQQLGPLDAAP